MTGHQPEPLTFIAGDARSQAAQEAIRVHVMRRQHRHRKQKQQQQAIANASSRQKATFEVWVPGSMLSATQETPISQPVPTESPPMAVEPDRKAGESTAVAALSLPSFPSLTQLLYHGKDAHKTHADRSAETILVQYFAVYGGESLLSQEVYHLYCQTVATYSAFLAVLATNYVKEKGISPPLDPVELENLAIREVNTHLSKSSGVPNESTMLAVAVLADLREYRNEHDKVQLHWDALRHMIYINGGLEVLRRSTSLCALFFWIEGVVFSHVSSSLGQGASGADVTVDPARDILQFFDDINESIADSHKLSGKPQHSLTEPIRTTMSRKPSRNQAYWLNKWRHARLGCLIYLAVFALESQQAVQKSSMYQAAEVEVLHRSQLYTMCPEEMYHVFLQTCNENDAFRMTLRVAQLLNAIKRLKYRDRHTCYNLLCTYLEYCDPYTKDMVSQDWSELSGRLSFGYRD